MANSIKFNLKEGDSIEINSTETFMRGIEQNINGGKIGTYATEKLTQINNKMEAKSGGQIINEVVHGELKQINNDMKSESEGKIINRVAKENFKKLSIIFAVGIFADLTSLYFFSLHIWEKAMKFLG